MATSNVSYDRLPNVPMTRYGQTLEFNFQIGKLAVLTLREYEDDNIRYETMLFDVTTEEWRDDLTTGFSPYGGPSVAELDKIAGEV